MKKTTRAMLLIAGLSASAAASAGIIIPSGAFIDRTGTNGPACALLGEGVTINLSKNVRAAFSCNTAATDIRVAACHAAGSMKTTMMDCAVIGVDAADGTTPIYNGGAACTGLVGQQWEITSYRVFEGSSRGGTVAAASLGAACDADGTVSGLAYLP